MVKELSARERQALRDLGAGSPPVELEARVSAALRADGLIRRGRPLSWRLLGLAAAASLLFVAGVGTQRYLVGALPAVAAASGDRYLLLLLEPAGAVLEPAVEAARVQEYSEWAGGLAARGLLQAGEKLADGGDVVGAPVPAGPTPTERVTGFFIVLVDTEEAALDVAATSPHVRHGGRVEVRLIEPT